MPTSDPEQPSLEDAAPQQNPNPPVDYPADAGLPPPVYPPLATGYPGYPGYHPVTTRTGRKPPGTNGKAIAALVTSLAGLVCCGLPSIAGLILGVIGMRETKRTGQDGYAIALTGADHRRTGARGWVIYLLLSIGIFASGWSVGAVTQLTRRPERFASCAPSRRRDPCPRSPTPSCGWPRRSSRRRASPRRARRRRARCAIRRPRGSTRRGRSRPDAG